MADEYYIDLNLTDAPQEKYKFPVGNVIAKQKKKKSDRGY